MMRGGELMKYPYARKEIQSKLESTKRQIEGMEERRQGLDESINKAKLLKEDLESVLHDLEK